MTLKLAGKQSNLLNYSYDQYLFGRPTLHSLSLTTHILLLTKMMILLEVDWLKEYSFAEYSENKYDVHTVERVSLRYHPMCYITHCADNKAIRLTVILKGIGCVVFVFESHFMSSCVVCYI